MKAILQRITQPKPLRIALITAIFYLAADLFLFHGPLDRVVKRIVTPRIAVEIFQNRLSFANLEPLARQQAWLDAASWESLTNPQKQEYRQDAANLWIDQILLAVQTQQSLPTLAPNALQKARDSWIARFETKEAFDESLRKNQLTDAELDLFLTGQLQLEQQLREIIQPLITISALEVENQARLSPSLTASPAAVNVSHIFLSKLDHSPEETEKISRELWQKLADKPDSFAALATESSDDATAKTNHGDLGWIARDERLPQEFAIFFSENRPALHTPFLLRSHIGIHIFRINDAREKKQVPERETEPVRRAALLRVKTQNAVNSYRATLRATYSASIHIHPSLADH